MATSSQYGVFVPSNNVWDIQQLQQIPDISPELKELLVRLYQNINNISLALNLKDTGVYNNSFETVNGQTWFPNPAYNSSTQANPTARQVLRKVLLWAAALPNTGTQTQAHGITCTANTTFTRIYGTASDTTGLHYIPIPYASSTLANNIEIKVDATNVTIITGSNRSNFNITYIVLEYLQV
jgi:hypothetical protein